MHITTRAEKQPRGKPNALPTRRCIYRLHYLSSIAQNAHMEKRGLHPSQYRSEALRGLGTKTPWIQALAKTINLASLNCQFFKIEIAVVSKDLV